MPRTAKKRKNIVKQVEKSTRKKIKVSEPKRDFVPSEFVSSGSTLLNLALTDHPKCAWQKGKMVNLIGDSSSGKTIMALTTFAEANIDESLDDYLFIMDDVENANEFDMDYLFGESVAARVKAPREDKEGPIPSNTVEDFHDNIGNVLETGKPFLYVLDSFDALDANEDIKKRTEMRAARNKGNKAKGTYGMAKPKKASEILRDIKGTLKKSGSVLIIISQTRDNIDPVSFTKKTRSGGRALKFYATHEMWTAVGTEIKHKNKVVGVNCIIKVSKNKITGKRRTVEVPIYYDYGIDDIGSCIDFLVEEDYWKQAKNSSTINPQGDLGLEPSSRSKLISTIENKNLEGKLQRRVAEVWKEIEDSLKTNRKRKYH